MGGKKEVAGTGDDDHQTEKQNVSSVLEGKNKSMSLNVVLSLSLREKSGWTESWIFDIWSSGKRFKTNFRELMIK